MKQMKTINKSKSSKAITLMLIIAILASLFIAIPTMNVSAASSGSFTLSVDKTIATQGDVITATLSIKNITNFAGYQANLKYDPSVLQPIIPFGTDFLPYGNLTPVEPGELLANSKFSPLDIVFNDVDVGILSFGRSYVQLASYKSAGATETTGSVAVIRFRVLRSIATEIYFKGTNILPTGLEGTALYDCDAKQIYNYDVIEPGTLLTGSSSTPKIITPVPVTPTVNNVPEDINGDKAVNMADVILIAGCFNSTSTSSLYNKKCDLNNDGSVNMADVIKLALKFNYTY
ncbi:MAG: cohesin domain-containing protein [Bacillota bacterium]|nr:cohesin domain-containing protein [Bacillota bacterium]